MPGDWILTFPDSPPGPDDAEMRFGESMARCFFRGAELVDLSHIKASRPVRLNYDALGVVTQSLSGDGRSNQGCRLVKLQAFLPLATCPDSNSDATASNATAIAAYLDAELHAEVINAHIPDVSNVMSRLLLKLPKFIREAEAASRQRGEHLLEKIRAEAAKKAVNLTTGVSSATLALIGEAAAMEARYFDISLLGWETGNPTSRATAEAVMFGSGRPAILLPETLAFEPIDHVAIAWDGSRVAARAVADARPFLERASKVTVLTVVGEKPKRELECLKLTANGNTSEEIARLLKLSVHTANQYLTQSTRQRKRARH